MFAKVKIMPTLAILGVISLVLTGTRHIVPARSVMQMEAELDLQTIALVDHIFEEADTKAYDEHSVNGIPVKIPAHFTPPSTLGPDPGETDRTDFDDFDDYHGYTTTISDNQGNTLYMLNAEVTYVKKDTYTPTDSATTFKMLVVHIDNPYLQGRVTDRYRTFSFEYVRNYYIR